MRTFVQRASATVMLVAASHLSAQDVCKATPVSGFAGLSVSAKGISCADANSVAANVLLGHKPAGWKCQIHYTGSRTARQTCTKDAAQVYFSYYAQ